MSVTHSTAAARNALASALAAALGPGFQLVLHAGTPPANCDAALASNPVVSTVTNCSLTGPVNGVLTVSGSTPDPAAAGGTATFFRCLTSGGTPVFQGLVGPDLTMSNPVVPPGIGVSFTGTDIYTAPP